MSGIIGGAGSKSGIVNFQRPFGIARGNNNIGGSSADYEFINWLNVEQGTQTYFDNSTGRFTAPIKGYYHFWCMFIKNNIDTTVRMYIRKNNTASANLDSSCQARAHGGGTISGDNDNYASSSANVIYQLDAGEYVSCHTITGYFDGSREYLNFAWQYIQEN